MPLLNLQGEVIADSHNNIIPFAEITDKSNLQAVLIEGDSNLDALIPHLDDLQLIVISFPSFSDGRGFSQAHWLRRHNYQGELRAKGWLLPDQLRHLLQCGFSSIDLDDTIYQRHGTNAWQKPMMVKPNYQRGYAGALPDARKSR